MITSRLLRDALRATRRHKLRSAFMMLGTFVGVAALAFVLTVGGAARQKLILTVRQLFGPSAIVVTGGGGFFMGGPRGDAGRLTVEDGAAVAAALPAIETWDAIQIVPGAAVRRGGTSQTVRLFGESERSEQVWARGVSQGEYFDATAVASSARVALIGETAARVLFGPEDPLDGEIQIGTVPFRVIGVLEAMGTDIHGMDRDNEIVIPISTMMRRVMNVDVVRALKFLARDPQRVAQTGDAVTQILRERHGLAEGRPSGFSVTTSANVENSVRRVEDVLFLYLPLVAGIVLVAGAAVAATLMLSAVNERTGEIGLRRAVGARPQDIRLQFLVETAVNALGGGALGIIAGTGLAFYLGARFALDVSVSPAAVLLGLAVAAGTGLLAGVAPAQRAARLEPAAALR